MSRIRLMIAAGAIVASSCSPSTPAATSTSSSTSPASTSSPAAAPASSIATTPPSSPAPVGATFRPADGRPTAGGEGELVLERCRWRWFDRYELDLTWLPADGDSGAELPVDMFILVGDTGAPGASGVIELPGPGDHVVTVVPTPVPPADGDRVYGSMPPPGDCVLARSDREPQSRFVTAALEVDVVPPTDVLANSLQALFAERADDDALLLLASVLDQWKAIGEFPLDRVYVDPDGTAGSVELEVEGTCVLLRQRYDTDDEFGVTVEQRRGCIQQYESGEFRVLRVVDEQWEVLVSGLGDEVDRVAERLVGYSVAGVEPVDGPPTPSVEEFMSGWLAERPGFRLGATFEWDGRSIVVVENTNAPGFERYADPIVIPEFNVGGGTLPCREYTIISQDDGAVGFRIVITDDPTLVFTTPLADGTTRVAELERGDNGAWFDLVDLADAEQFEIDAGGQTAVLFVETVVTTADGGPAPCTQ